MYDTEFEVIPYDTYEWEEELADRYIRNIFRLDDAAKNGDWEKVDTLITLNPEIMEDGLKRVYPLLPDEYKFSIPTDCQRRHGDCMPGVRKYVRQARRYAPIEKRIPAEMIGLPKIVVCRAGEEPIDRAAYRISWTTNLDVAKWFYDRAVTFRWPQRHIYRGVIKPEKIIRYSDGRQEKEVMQYNNVRNIVELER